MTHFHDIIAQLKNDPTLYARSKERSIEKLARDYGVTPYLMEVVLQRLGHRPLPPAVEALRPHHDKMMRWKSYGWANDAIAETLGVPRSRIDKYMRLFYAVSPHDFDYPAVSFTELKDRNVRPDEITEPTVLTLHGQPVLVMVPYDQYQSTRNEAA